MCTFPDFPKRGRIENDRGASALRAGMSGFSGQSRLPKLSRSQDSLVFAQKFDLYQALNTISTSEEVAVELNGRMTFR